MRLTEQNSKSHFYCIDYSLDKSKDITLSRSDIKFEFNSTQNESTLMLKIIAKIKLTDINDNLITELTGIHSYVCNVTFQLHNNEICRLIETSFSRTHQAISKLLIRDLGSFPEIAAPYTSCEEIRNMTKFGSNLDFPRENIVQIP